MLWNNFKFLLNIYAYMMVNELFMYEKGIICLNVRNLDLIKYGPYTLYQSCNSQSGALRAYLPTYPT